MSQDGQMQNKKLLHPVLCKTAEWGGLHKSSLALENLRQANEPNFAASIASQKSFYLPGEW